MKRWLIVLFTIFLIPLGVHAVTLEKLEQLQSEIGMFNFGTITFTSHEERYNGLKRIRNELKELLEQNPKDPRLWFLMGENSSAFLYAYADSGEKLTGQRKMEQMKANEKHRRDLSLEFQKAFEFELSTEKGVPHLSCAMLTAVFIDNSYEALLVARKRIENCTIESSVEVDMRSTVAVGMAKLGKLDEALAELDKIREVYKSMGQDPSRVDEYGVYVERLAREAAEKESQLEIKDTYAQADTYSAPKAAPVQKPIKAVEPKQAK